MYAAKVLGSYHHVHIKIWKCCEALWYDYTNTFPCMDSYCI